MPLGLAQQGPSLYLVARYCGYDNERCLALHRIHTAEASTLTFERPDFDLKTFDDNGRFGLGTGVSISITFEITQSAGLHLLEARLSADQQVEELEEHYRITATVIDSEWLWRWVRAFGLAIREVNVDGRSVDPLAPRKRSGKR